MLIRVLISTIVFLVTAVPITASDKPDFSGTWHLSEPAADGDKADWSIVQDGDNIRLTQPASKAKTDINCTTRGKDCEATVDGNPVKVTYWYNGPMLVEMCFEGDRVTKTRRKLSPDGKTMTVEVISISPARDPRKLVFVRTGQQVVATR
jgi:hypothetical protein